MNSKLPIHGAFTALVTPFTPDSQALDIEAFESLVQSQIDGGISGLVPCGTTGESPTLSDDEQRELIRRTVSLAKGKVPVIAGTGS
ncbi:MAG: dihydrodipicolinate synthase family protein, partial [Coriobacteriia bacterium]|nr:dihydrodipicolinate synthase family protein [Coriobacteriia bacterium]